MRACAPRTSWHYYERCWALTDKWERVLTLHLMDQEDAVDPTIEEQFNAFHETNPQVLEELVELTDELIEHGSNRGSIGMLFEVLRWQKLLETDANFDLGLNFPLKERYEQMRSDLRVN